MKSKHTCPICGDGQFEPLIEVVALPYKDQEIKVASRMSLCSACGSEFVNAEDSRVNKRSVLAARKRFDGLLSGEEIYAIRKKYELDEIIKKEDTNATTIKNAQSDLEKVIEEYKTLIGKGE